MMHSPTWCFIASMTWSNMIWFINRYNFNSVGLQSLGVDLNDVCGLLWIQTPLNVRIVKRRKRKVYILMQGLKMDLCIYTKLFNLMWQNASTTCTKYESWNSEVLITYTHLLSIFSPTLRTAFCMFTLLLNF